MSLLQLCCHVIVSPKTVLMFFLTFWISLTKWKGMLRFHAKIIIKWMENIAVFACPPYWAALSWMETIESRPDKIKEHLQHQTSWHPIAQSDNTCLTFELTIISTLLTLHKLPRAKSCSEPCRTVYNFDSFIVYFVYSFNSKSQFWHSQIDLQVIL